MAEWRQIGEDAATTAFGVLGAVGGGLVAGKRNREFAREMAVEAERLSGSAFQRARADMEKAGLNPILGMASSGGAMTPSIAPGAMEQPGNMGAGAVSAFRASQERRALAAQTSTTKAVGRKEDMQSGLYEQQKVTEHWKQDHLRALVANQRHVNVGSALEAEINASRYGRGAAYGAKALPFVNTVVGAATARAIGRSRGLPPGGGVLRRPSAGGGPKGGPNSGYSSQRERGQKSGAPGPRPGRFNPNDIPY